MFDRLIENACFYYNLLTDMYFFITGLGDDGMEESGPREAVLVQEADDGEEEEETGSRTKTFVFKSR